MTSLETIAGRLRSVLRFVEADDAPGEFDAEAFGYELLCHQSQDDRWQWAVELGSRSLIEGSAGTRGEAEGAAIWATATRINEEVRRFKLPVVVVAA